MSNVKNYRKCQKNSSLEENGLSHDQKSVS